MQVAFARKAYLEVRDDGVVIRHPGIFRKPVLVPRRLISVAAFDERKASFKRFRDHHRFHLAGDLSDTRGEEPPWLYSKVGGSPLPLLSHVHDVPNLALLFTHPIKLQPPRRGVKPFPAKTVAHPPVHGHRSRGLLIRVRDTHDIERAFRRWGVARPLGRSDIYSLAPTPAEVDAARRRVSLTNVAILAVVVLQAAAPLLLYLIGDRVP
jgi:hypothetical protein